MSAVLQGLASILVGRAEDIRNEGIAKGERKRERVRVGEDTVHSRTWTEVGSVMEC